MICLAIASCGHQKNKDTESLVETQGSTQTEPFNLAKVAVGQNINEILKSAGATEKEAVRTNEVTLIGNEKLAFSSKELLHFNGIDLEGKNHKNTNKVRKIISIAVSYFCGTSKS